MLGVATGILWGRHSGLSLAGNLLGQHTSSGTPWWGTGGVLNNGLCVVARLPAGGGMALWRWLCFWRWLPTSQGRFICNAWLASHWHLLLFYLGLIGAPLRLHAQSLLGAASGQRRSSGVQAWMYAAVYTVNSSLFSVFLLLALMPLC
jgi:hypothetical protein